MPKERINGIDISYEAHGDGVPLVLAHGYTASLEMWREQVPAFSAKHRLVIYDARGHGGTTAPPGMEAYDLARDYVGDQLALMDHLGIEQAYVGGLSMGGMVAQEFALQHPSRVKALLLYDTGPGLGAARRDPAEAAQMEQWRNMMSTMARTRGMGAIIDAMAKSPMWAARAAATAGGAPASVTRHLDGMRRMSVDGYLGGSKAMQTWGGSAERLGEIKAPALVLVGEQDRLLPASRFIHQHIAGSRFVLLKNAGHGTSMWRPNTFAKATLEFLADVEAGRPVAGAFET
jgi:pimeloyl-ACP methyl ester carboxylesterase